MSGSQDLAERATKAPGWQWLPGMQALFPRWPPIRVMRVRNHLICGVVEEKYGDELRCDVVGIEHAECRPDFDDPATRGCFLDLVRRVRKEPQGFLTAQGKGWTYYTGLYGADYWTGVTEAEALILALEAATVP